MSIKKIEEPMLTLNTESIKDFQTCALLYNYRHLQHMYEPIGKRELLALRYENTLKKIASFFFYKKQGGAIPSPSALLNRWEKHWFPKEMDSYDLMVEQQETISGNLASFSNDATNALLKFYEDFSGDVADPVLINESYTIPMSRNVRFEGSFDLVLRSKNEYRVIKWLARHRRPNVSTLMLDFAALRQAFEYRNDNRSMHVTYGFYDLASPDNSGFVPVDVEDEDINALAYWANEAATTEVFASRRGLTTYCKSCPFDKPCSEFVITEEMLKSEHQ